MNAIRVGIVGASARGGWARDSHVPAIARVAGLELAAVASSTQERADAAAAAFGVRAAFGDAAALVRDPGIDLVAISVNVPAHRELVLGALAAGKHVLCEWPLGRDTAESMRLAEAARQARVHTAIGLQTRANPAARRAREVVASGSLGRVLGARMYATTAAFGRSVPTSMTYAEDAANGVTLASIQGAHAIDLAIFVVGAMRDVSALLATQYSEIAVGDDAEPRLRTTPDHVVLHARLAGGGTLAIEVVGGRPPDETPFRFEVTGDRGTLLLHGGAMRGFQSGRLRLHVDGEALPADETAMRALPESAANVADMYAILRDDIVDDTWRAPDFAHAVRLARLLDDVTASSRTGARVEASDWPTT